MATTFAHRLSALYPRALGPFRVALAILALVLTGAVSGADMTRDWAALNRLKPGGRLRVQVQGKEVVTAEFGAVTDQTLQLVRNNEQIEFARQDVLRVERLRKRSRVRAALPWIGAGAGFSTGFAYGYALGDGPSRCVPGTWCLGLMRISKPVSGAIAGAAGAGLGGLAGYFLAGSRVERPELIYQKNETGLPDAGRRF